MEDMPFSSAKYVNVYRWSQRSEIWLEPTEDLEVVLMLIKASDHLLLIRKLLIFFLLIERRYFSFVKDTGPKNTRRTVTQKENDLGLPLLKV